MLLTKACFIFNFERTQQCADCAQFKACHVCGKWQPMGFLPRFKLHRMLSSVQFQTRVPMEISN